MHLQIVPNKLTDYLRRRQILRGTEILKRFFLNGINEHSQSCSLIFHGVNGTLKRSMVIKL
ncbi:hypothetical protein IV02_10485 [Pseudomonas syringae]|uniref:Uncharacterized protein n=1 Tax=Pseudomonas syringae TaxID=317 RepID=A0A085V9P8_PSESX|nr:hypothetical protein IV02_10485 [Pseudomonas syringae]